MLVITDRGNLRQESNYLEVDDDMFAVVVWPESQMFMNIGEYGGKIYIINDKEGIEKYGTNAIMVPILDIMKFLK